MQLTADIINNLTKALRTTNKKGEEIWKDGVIDKLIFNKKEFKRVMKPLIDRWTEDGKSLDSGK